MGSTRRTYGVTLARPRPANPSSPNRTRSGACGRSRLAGRETHSGASGRHRLTSRSPRHRFTLSQSYPWLGGLRVGLFWHRRILDNFGGFGNLGEYKQVVEAKLRDMGYANTEISDLDVGGDKGGVRLSIGYFEVTDRRHWEVVMAGGVEPEPRAVRDEVVEMLRIQLHPL